ncbi:methylaspartate ammonia-lyase [Paraburkholderia sp. D1E]|uniref:methylaspartate ammonia-lyase n=1 Tax=Paraburkholderia sp. D1E TaxID=3461398 RepID=UPI0040467E1B
MPKITDVRFVPSRGGYFNIDLAAQLASPTRNGFLYEGEPVTPGFERIVQPGEAISVLLLLNDGQVAVGEGVSVILAGVAGRDAVFRPAAAMDLLDRQLRPRLVGRELRSASQLAQEIDAIVVNGKPIHNAIRYGTTQAIFHAVALSRHRMPAEVIADEYVTSIATVPIRILAASEQSDSTLIDRAILKRADLLPHGAFSSVENDLGHDGGKLLDYAAKLTARIRQIGGSEYFPSIHFDMYGSVEKLFGHAAAMAEFLDRLADAVAPFPLLIESPIIKETQQDQFDCYRKLRDALACRSSTVKIVIDEWCNTLSDIRECSRLGVADFVQIKCPDMGGINNIIEAILLCRAFGMGSCLGGSANETDISARMTAQIALACQPDFLMSKPGLGFDEGHMILTNEMLRTLAVLETRK